MAERIVERGFAPPGFSTGGCDMLNPFRDTIVASPWENTRVDVPGIHGRVYEQCLRGIEHVRQHGRSAAVLIHGEAGSGKTHLLCRLRARLTPQEPTATHRAECLFVWVRLQTHPRMIWRALRRTLVEDWFRPVAGRKSQFERILFHRLAELRPAEGDLERWYEYMLERDPEGLAELIDQIATNLHLDRNTAVAFTHIAFGRHLRDLRAWLAGTSLPQAALERMDLAQEDGNDEEREDESRQIVLMLCHLAGNGLPIVLSFDQVEALQVAPGDRDALFLFGQFLSALHDSTQNVLLVSCVQSAFATELKDHARSADYDRMTSLGALSLDPLNRLQAEQLIAARRAVAGEPPSPEEPRPACWPLEPAEFDELFARGFLSPRKLLACCAEKYDRRTAAPGVAESRPIETGSGPAESMTNPVAAFLDSQWHLCVQERLAANNPDRTDEIVQHGLPLLMPLLAPEARPVRDEQLRDVSLIFEDASGRTGLSVCAQSNMNSLAARLKRLKAQFALQRLRRLVLVRDARMAVSEGARAARQHLDDLERQHVHFAFPTPEALAALDAVRELVSDAKSGDLACQGDAIPPRVVEEWLSAHLPARLREFVDEVLGRRSRPAGLGTAGGEDIDAVLALPARIAVSVESVRATH